MSDLNAINELCERGNILITSREETRVNAWLRIPDHMYMWLQISYYPCNYPALYVSTITTTEKALASHIIRKFHGSEWAVLKMNLEGVRLDDDTIVLRPEDMDEWGAIECLDYIRDEGIEYVEPAETAEVNLDEVRALCKQHRAEIIGT